MHLIVCAQQPVIDFTLFTAQLEETDALLLFNMQHQPRSPPVLWQITTHGQQVRLWFWDVSCWSKDHDAFHA